MEYVIQDAVLKEMCVCFLVSTLNQDTSTKLTAMIVPRSGSLPVFPCKPILYTKKQYIFRISRGIFYSPKKHPRVLVIP